MPRRSMGSSRMGGSRGASPTRNTSYAQAPPRNFQAPPTSAPSRGGMFSGLGGVLAQGMAFGAGSEIAHQAIRGVTGSGHHQPQVVYQQAPEVDQSRPQQNMNKCQWENTQFIECLKKSDNSIGQCQSFFDMLKECEKKVM